MGKAVKGKPSCTKPVLLSKGSGFRDFKDNKFLLKTESMHNPIALRKAKLCAILAFLSAIGLKGRIFSEGSKIFPLRVDP